jgi:predicted aspartyl protease
MQTPQKDNGQRFGQCYHKLASGILLIEEQRSTELHTWKSELTTEQAQDAPGVVLGTFSVNSVLVIVLFDSGASHSFITEQFVAKHGTPISSMKTHLLISSPNGEMKCTYVCPQVNLKIRGIDFQADLVVLTSSGIDLILGMDWLGKCDGIILCAKKSVLLNCPQGDKIEVVATAPSKKEGKVNQDEGKQEKKL